MMAKILLREIRKSDLSLMREWRNQNREAFHSQAIITPEMQTKWYEQYLKNDNELLFIIETEDGTPIGTYGFKHIDHVAKKAEAGNLILGDKRFSGQGMGTKIVRASMEYAFTELGLNELYADQLAGNKRAVVANAKAGWRIVGFNEPDTICVSMTKEEFFE